MCVPENTNRDKTRRSTSITRTRIGRITSDKPILVGKNTTPEKGVVLFLSSVFRIRIREISQIFEYRFGHLPCAEDGFAFFCEIGGARAVVQRLFDCRVQRVRLF